MKRGQKEGGKKGNIHLPLQKQRVSFSWTLRYQPLDISLIMMYKSLHSLTAMNRLFWMGKKRMTREREREKRLNFLMSVLDRVQTFKASHWPLCSSDNPL